MDEYVDNDHPGYAAPMPRHSHKWLDIECHERGDYPVVDVAYLLRTCQHCEDPPCAKPVPGAVHKRADGIVIIDPKAAIGAREIVSACPYGAIHWNEELNLPQHWNLDAHLLDAGWTENRATQACPTGALQLLKMEDKQLSTFRREHELVELRPELHSRPRLLYKNLHRVRAKLLSGTLLTGGELPTDVVDGAAVTLHDSNGGSMSTRSDAFGDFKFDAISPQATSCVIEIQASGFKEKRLEVDLIGSLHLGDLVLVHS